MLEKKEPTTLEHQRKKKEMVMIKKNTKMQNLYGAGCLEEKAEEEEEQKAEKCMKTTKEKKQYVDVHHAIRHQ